MRAARVVIVGGGPAGAAVALSLARTGLTPIVVEAQAGSQLKVGECLPPSVNPLLRQLGLVDHVSRAGLPSHGNRYMWGSDEASERDFIFGAAGAGWQLDRRRFEEELAGAAVAAGAGWRFRHRLVGCSRERGGGWQLTINTGRGVDVCQADFVVDASGRAARFARLLGVRRIRYDRLVGLSTYLQRDPRARRQDEDSLTVVEAVAGGWWYSARLPGGKLIAAYLTDGDLLDRAGLRQDGWSTLLRAAPHTQSRVSGSGYSQLQQPRISPAHTSRLSAIAGIDWLAVGDAAVARDPLASHGITAALGTGYYAAAAVRDYLGGRREALLDYARLVDQDFARYLILHHEHYRAEGRWADSTFWRRRL
ncbi:MAG TPA: tryptophan 7-halogenase [Propionibacteriaceae bacterium]|nr:tryptophan 7-halogenase [Propionibacteriaceae bacterium]